MSDDARQRIDIHAHVFPRITREEAAAADPRAPWLAETRRRRRPHHAGRRALPAGGGAAVGSARAPRAGWTTRASTCSSCAPRRSCSATRGTPRAAAAWCARMNDLALEFCAADPRAAEGAGAGAAAGHRRRVPRSHARARASATSACRSATTSAPKGLDDPGHPRFPAPLRRRAHAGARASVGHDGRRADEEVDAAVAGGDAGGDAARHPVAILSGAFERLPRNLDTRVRARRRQLRVAARAAWTTRGATATSCARIARNCRRPTATASAWTRRSSTPARCACWWRRWARERVMLGTDAPFPLGETAARVRWSTSTFAGDAARASAILAGNARRVFDLA